MREHDCLCRPVRRAGEQLERAAAVGLGAVATAVRVGHGVAAAVLGRCLKDIGRSETIRGRAGKPSTAPSESCRRARPGIAMAAITKRASAASSARASIGPVFYTFAKSPLLPKSRDVTYRQCKCLSVLACDAFGADLNRSESRLALHGLKSEMGQTRPRRSKPNHGAYPLWPKSGQTGRRL